MGYFREKNKCVGDWVEYILFWKIPVEFLDRLFISPLEILDRTKLHPSATRNSTRLCYTHPSEILRPKTKTSGYFTWFFLDHPWKFHLLFLQYPYENSISSPHSSPPPSPPPLPPPPPLFFFWNSPITVRLLKMELNLYWICNL